jgi:DNA-binding NtrC family response regulator
VIPIRIPPLRERREDIIPLVDHYLSRLAVRTDKEIHEISPAALTALYDYDYPGNVRELTNILERAFVLCHQEQIDLVHLPPEVVAAGGRGAREQNQGDQEAQPRSSQESTGDDGTASSSTDARSGEDQAPEDWPSRLKPSEHRLLSTAEGRTAPARMRPEVRRLLDVLDAHQWRRGETAKALGISRSTLWRRMKEYGLA